MKVKQWYWAAIFFVLPLGVFGETFSDHHSKTISRYCDVDILFTESRFNQHFRDNVDAENFLRGFKDQAANQNRISGLVYSQTDEPYFVISKADASDSLKRRHLYEAVKQSDAHKPYSTNICLLLDEDREAFYEQTLQDLNRYGIIGGNFIESFKTFLKIKSTTVKIRATNELDIIKPLETQNRSHHPIE